MDEVKSSEEPSAKRQKVATELLEQLRNHQSDIFSVIADRNYARAMDLLIEHKNEFPIKIQEKIQELDGEKSPDLFFRQVESASIELFTAAEREGQPWRGLDSDRDTQEQVEVAVRFFPNVLNEGRSGVTPSGVAALWHSPFQVSFWVSACQRSLPFAPLLVVLAFELEEFLKRFNGRWSFARWSFARQFLLDDYSPTLVDDDLDRRLDELTLSTFKQLITRNLIQKGSEDVFSFCRAAIELRPARIERTLLHLIDWDKTVLDDSHRMGTYGLGCRNNGIPLIWNCWHLPDNIGVEATRQRFRMMFERAIAQHPHDMGFLFHNQCKPLHGQSCIYSMLTHYLGTEQVRNIVIDVIRRTTHDYTSEAIRSLLFSIADREDIEVDAVYLLIRSNPNKVLGILRSCSHLPWQIGMEATRQRFRMILELAIAQHPDDLGFLFHNNLQNMAGRTVFSELSRHLGAEQVRDTVLDVIGRTTRDYTPEAIRSLLFSIADRDDIAVDAFYLLIQSNPNKVLGTLRSCSQGMEATRQRFMIFFERAIAQHPHDLGFLFHNNLQNMAGRTVFSLLSRNLGAEQVRNIVLDVIGRTTRDCTSEAIRSLLFSIAGREDIAVDAVYLLIQSNPNDVLA